MYTDPFFKKVTNTFTPKLCKIGWAIRTSPLPIAGTSWGVIAQPLGEGVRPSGQGIAAGMLAQCEGMDIVDCDVTNTMILHSCWVPPGKHV